MQIRSEKIDFLVGDTDILCGMPAVPSLPMFSEQMTDFLSALSRELLNDRKAKQFMDVVSYAYWIRKASLTSVTEKHTDRKNRIGRGTAIHFAPSNVPVNFAVSMTSSLLAGNCTAIRISNKKFEQADIICGAINKLIENEFTYIRPYLCIMRYDYDADITRELSSICDIRIIWGGDRTIEEIRKAPLPPRAIEMTFSDRHSIAVINSDEYLKCDPDKTAKDFYTDTYYTDQNACSSPRLVVWTGNNISSAKKIFWNALKKIAEKDYDMKPIQAVDKYSSVCMLGMSGTSSAKLVSEDNLIMRTEVESLSEDLMDYKNSGGLFYEYSAADLSELVPVLSKQCQTISVLGVPKEDILELVFKYGVKGVDRIVPLGQTMGLEFIWDGFKMIENMTRFIYSGSY